MSIRYALTSDINISRDLVDAPGNPIHVEPVPISSGGEAVPYAFVIRTGAVPGAVANVFPDWPSFYAVAKAFEPVLVEIDSTAGPVDVPAGTYTFLGSITLQSHDFNSTLTILTGATITSPTIVIQSLILNSTSTAPIFVLPNAAEVTFDNAAIQNFFPAPAPLFSVPDGFGLVILSYNSAIGEGTGAVITLAATGETSPLVALANTSVAANAITGPGTANVILDSSSTVFGPQTVTTYTPILAGLNEITVLAAAGIGAGATISQNGAPGGTPITRQRAGNFEVTVEATFQQSVGTGAGTITMQLLKDNVIIPVSPKAEVSLADGSFGQLKLTFLATVTDFAAHQFGWTATTSGGTCLVPGAGAYIYVKEL